MEIRGSMMSVREDIRILDASMLDAAVKEHNTHYAEFYRMLNEDD